MQTHQRCEELALEFLTQAAVGAYLGARFAERQLPGGLAQVIHHRTDGNPLFMVNVTDYLVGQGVLRQVEEQWTLTQGLEDIEVGVPENLWQMLEKQLAGLSREAQKILEAGSVGGIEFSAAAIAAGLERDVESVEEQCERLVRQGQLLQARDIAEWPDGTVSAQYRFIHGLYQEVLYTRVVGRRRVRLHQRIGERLEDAYGKQASEIAAELAMHFEVGRDPGRAVRYLRKAAENALRRSANQEAIIHLNKGLELLKTLPDTPQRAQQELTLLMALGLPLMTTKGYAAPEVESAYTRARELCQQMGEAPQLFSVLGGLRAFYSMRAEFLTAHDLSQQIFGLSQRLQDPAHLLWGHQALGDSSLWLGEVAVASTHLEQGLAFYRFQKDSLPAFRSAHDPGVICLSAAAIALWLLGYPDQALARVQEMFSRAQELADPDNLVWAFAWGGVVHQLRQEAAIAQEQAEALITLSTEHRFPIFRAGGMMMRSWAVAEQGQGREEVTQMRKGLAAWRATGAERQCPYYLALIARVCGQAGQVQEGLDAVAEALACVGTSEERWWEAELYRTKGELLLQFQVQRPKFKVSNPQSLTPNPQEEAEACFQQAIDIARRQEAKSLELRAVVSLSRLWRTQGKKTQARKMLAKSYEWFTEGFDTKDLQEAKTFLEELA